MTEIVVSSSESVISPPSASNLTTLDLIEACKRHLYTGGKEERNKLAGGVDATTTTFSFQFPLASIGERAKVSVDLEDTYVWTAAGTSATVERGQFGSVASTHADGAIVTVNARFTDAEILRALNDELRDLSSPLNGIFRILAIDLTYDYATRGYDLAGIDPDSIYEIRAHRSGDAMDWPLVSHWSVTRGMAPALFASGNALLLYDGVSQGEPVRVRAKAALGSLTNLTDVVSDVTGLPVTALDIPPLGAAARLAAGREIRRNFNESQGDTRRAEEVPPGANLSAPRGLLALRASRIAAESARLSQRYPDRVRR